MAKLSDVIQARNFGIDAQSCAKALFLQIHSVKEYAKMRRELSEMALEAASNGLPDMDAYLGSVNAKLKRLKDEEG